MKKCSKCKQIKSKSEFYKDNSRKDGLFGWCKECQNKHNKKYYEEYYNHPEVKERISKKGKEYRNQPEIKKHKAKQSKEYRNQPKIKEQLKKRKTEYNNRPEIKNHQQNYRLKRKYGITIKDKQKILKEQNGLCAICKKELNGDQEAFIDHDHKTDIVRGILCSNCNFMLGLSRDNVDILCKAIDYLKKYS